jgi:uncharacterized repeat protein (TIGR01451 family)
LLPRYTTDDRANFVVFGNTTGFDCRDGVQEKPIVGTVPTGPGGLFACRGLLPDTTRGDDILWRSDDPQNGQALASALIAPNAARSTAVLSLPPGAKVVYARLYWAGQRLALLGAGTQVSVERPGVFQTPVQADTLRGSSTFPLGLLAYYQSSADITTLVQQYGTGAYRISGIDTVDLISQNLNTLFVGWTAVVIYSLATDPPRNIALYDGFEHVSVTSGTPKTTLTVGGLTATNGTVSAKLGIVAYGGNSDIVGDQLLVNSTAMSNTYNPATNFFNRSSTNLGGLLPQTGDLPQMSGRPGSLSGMDIDVVDISSAVPASSTQFTVEANTTQDEYFVGSVVSAVSAIRPVFGGTTKTVTNLTRQDGRNLPGDTLEYTITAQNTGNDPGTKVMVTDVIPANTTYVTGSINVVTGANQGAKSDAVDTDQAEYVAAARMITVRLGTGATGTTGGTLNVNESSSFRFRVTINSNATGTVSNQATISAVGQTAAGQGNTTPVPWPSGNAQNPGQPTVITITTCSSNADCTPVAPICDTTAVPPQCVCRTNNDCSNNQLCDPTTRRCVDCLPGMTGNCNGNTVGAICLPSDVCGCVTNADCNGRACNTTLGVCAAVNTDLGLTLTRTPAGTTVAPGTPLTYNLTVTNKGGVPLPAGTQLSTTLSPSAALTWTCTASGGAQCPAASGSGPVPALGPVPAGGALNFVYSTAAPSDPASTAVDFTATITPPRGYADTNPADNTVTDSVLVGMVQGGPDLSIDVVETQTPGNPAVTYTVNVTNHGPGDAPGATISYQVPDNTTVDLLGGDGWTCSQQGTVVTCTRTAPITDGQTTSVQFVVHPEGGQSSIPLHATVTGTDPAGNPLNDPDPSNNTVDRTTNLPPLHLAGGGLSFGCSVLAGREAPGLFEAAAALLLLVALLRASRRRVLA